jgi:hypothetical protein
MITAFAVIIAIPAYLGAIEFAAWRSFIYSAVAASGMAAGEYVDASRRKRGSIAVYVQTALLWWLVVIVLGGFAYVAGLRWAAWRA